MLKKYYFAFGSNMLLERMQERVCFGDGFGMGFFRQRNRPKRKVKLLTASGTYRLMGWKLVFNCGGMTGSYANIVKGLPTDYVDGVLYELTDEQESILDRYENWPTNYEKRYFPYQNGSILFAYVSVNPGFASDRLPYKDYLDILITGALQNNLIETYNKLVDFRIAHSKEYRLNKGSKFKKIAL